MSWGISSIILSVSLPSLPRVTFQPQLETIYILTCRIFKFASTIGAPTAAPTPTCRLNFLLGLRLQSQDTSFGGRKILLCPHYLSPKPISPIFLNLQSTPLTLYTRHKVLHSSPFSPANLLPTIHRFPRRAKRCIGKRQWHCRRSSPSRMLLHQHSNQRLRVFHLRLHHAGKHGPSKLHLLQHGRQLEWNPVGQRSNDVLPGHQQCRQR